MKQHRSVMLCMSLLVISSSSFAQIAAVPAAPSLPIDFSKHSDKFIEEAAHRGMQEIELGKLALQKSTDRKVEEMASAIVKDRTAANEDLQRVAAKERLIVPAPDDPQGDAAIGDLKSKSGRNFEAAYAQHVAADYHETIRLFEAEAKSPDADLANFARTTLPALNAHLHMVDALTQATASDRGKAGVAPHS